jgi:hypothetical protein
LKPSLNNLSVGKCANNISGFGMVSADLGFYSVLETRKNLWILLLTHTYKPSGSAPEN